jgi:hypothetical protein
MARSNHRKTDLTTFDALDQLPAELYREVTFAARVWDATDVLALYKGRGSTQEAINWLAASIQAGDEADVIDFAWKYRMKHKTPLPHFAAEATILRYETPVGVRRMALHRGAAPRVKAAWQAAERLLPR